MYAIIFSKKLVLVMTANWDDMRFFLAVAREGNLSAAARLLKVTQPTVGRRITGLEETLGERLFDRTPDGFIPTNAASDMVPIAETMEKTASALLRRRAAKESMPRGTVRLSMQEAIAQFLCQNLPELKSRLPEIEIELVVDHLDKDLSRHEADLLIRECLPDNPALIVRKLAEFSSAIYGSAEYVSKSSAAKSEGRYMDCDWVGYDEEHAYFQNQKWLLERLNGRLPEVRTNNAMVLHNAVRAGAGLGIMACFTGDNDPSLVRVSAPIPNLRRDLHLVVHRDLRRSVAVRAVMEVVHDIFKREKRDLLGELPTPTCHS
jgi:DNA-binding transcriptional LysR family regulator